MINIFAFAVWPKFNILTFSVKIIQLRSVMMMNDEEEDDDDVAMMCYRYAGETCWWVKLTQIVKLKKLHLNEFAYCT